MVPRTNSIEVAIIELCMPVKLELTLISHYAGAQEELVIYIVSHPSVNYWNSGIHTTMSIYDGSCYLCDCAGLYCKPTFINLYISLYILKSHYLFEWRRMDKTIHCTKFICLMRSYNFVFEYLFVT
jgi:hypothetical protein